LAFVFDHEGVLFLFPSFLTLHAVSRPRNGFQSFCFNVRTAFNALAIGPLAHSFNSLTQGTESLPGSSQLGAQMLASTSYSVAQIAPEMRYKPEAAFNRAFEREFTVPAARVFIANRDRYI